MCSLKKLHRTAQSTEYIAVAAADEKKGEKILVKLVTDFNAQMYGDDDANDFQLRVRANSTHMLEIELDNVLKVTKLAISEINSLITSARTNKIRIALFL